MLTLKKSKQYYAMPKKDALKEIRRNRFVEKAEIVKGVRNYYFSGFNKKTRKNDGIRIITKKIVPEQKYDNMYRINYKYDIGSYKITILEILSMTGKHRLKFYIKRKEGMLGSLQSPHVFNDHHRYLGTNEVCFGEQEEMLYDAGYNMDYYGVFILLIGLLTDGDYTNGELSRTLSFMYPAMIQRALEDKKDKLAMELYYKYLDTICTERHHYTNVYKVYPENGVLRKNYSKIEKLKKKYPKNKMERKKNDNIQKKSVQKD